MFTLQNFPRHLSEAWTLLIESFLGLFCFPILLLLINFIPRSVFRILDMRCKSCLSAICPLFLLSPYWFFLDMFPPTLPGICLLFTCFFFDFLSANFHPLCPWIFAILTDPTKKNFLCTLLTSQQTYFSSFLHCPSFCHCGLNVLALLSNYLSLINSLYLATVLTSLLKFIIIKNVILIISWILCFLLFSLIFSLLLAHSSS